MRYILISLIVAVFAGQAVAHETRPAIADLTVTDGQVALDIRLNAEALLAGVDLEGVANTDDTEQSDQVDTLRALSPEALTDQLRDKMTEIVSPIVLRSGEVRIALSEAGIQAEPVGDVEIARDTLLRLTGMLPEGAATVTLNWPAAYGALVLRQQGVEEPYTGYLEGGEPSDAIAIAGGDAMTGMQAFLRYIPVGFDHILPKGLDHILFVLGLFFLSTRLGPLLWQVSAFTLAHTVTLALGALGWVNVPGHIVEPIIAASIVYVAVENILTDGLSRWRPVIVFLFGLLHGLGFASVLGEFGLPSGQFIPALIGFNIGVELGQLTVIAIAFLAVGYWFGKKDWYRRVISIPASCAIALVGSWWVIERTLL